MSYPEPVYLGEPGLANATLRPAGHPPEVRYPSGGTAHFLATGALTSGQFGLYRWEMAATQSGPEPHFHRTDLGVVLRPVGHDPAVRRRALDRRHA